MKIWPLLVTALLPLHTLAASTETDNDIEQPDVDTPLILSNFNEQNLLQSYDSSEDEEEEGMEDEMEEEMEEDEEEEEDFYGDEEFISIATGSQKQLHKAAAVANVITAADIERMGASSLAEVLEQVPGLHVRPSTQSRMDNTYVIRGMGTGFNPTIAVMINGLSIKNMYAGGLPFTFSYPVANIERIEIIRGPGSAVYGADAFSGVINIISKSAHKTITNIGGRTGSFDSNDVWLNTTYKQEDLEVNFAVNSLKSDGDHKRIAETDGQAVFDGIFGTSASLAPTHLATHYDILNIHADIEYGNFKFENWWWLQDNGGLGPGAAQAIDHTGTQDVETYRGAMTYKTDFSETTAITLQSFFMEMYSSSRFSVFPAGVKLPIGENGNINFANSVGLVTFVDGYIGQPILRNLDYGLNATIENTSFTNHKLRVNFGTTHHRIRASELKNFGPGVINGTEGTVTGALTDISTPDFIAANGDQVFLPNVERDNNFISLQDEWQFHNDVELVAGIRVDKYSDFGTTVNPRLAAVWQSTNKLTSKFLYGSAFRAPTFAELYAQNNPALGGNEDLQPETIDTFELAFDYRFAFDKAIQVNFFKYKADDLILPALSTDGDSSTQIINNNVGTQDGYGMEVATELKLTDKLNLQANYSVQISEGGAGNDGTDKMTVGDVPKNIFYLSVDYDINELFKFNINTVFVGNRTRVAGDDRDNIDDYWLTNASLSYLPSSLPLSATLSIKNLFDDDIREPSESGLPGDYKMPTRQILLEMRYTF